jgi:hypothetical protein
MVISLLWNSLSLNYYQEIRFPIPKVRSANHFGVFRSAVERSSILAEGKTCVKSRVYSLFSDTYPHFRVHFTAMMDVSNFHDLLSAKGQEAIDVAMELAPQEKDFLRYFQQLSRRFPREVARGALETAILRNSAQSKFPQADSMYFTREALEQASSFEVASHRAARYRGFKHIGDLGCSIGGDTLAFAGVLPAVGIDRDPLRLAMAKANMDALGLKASFIQSDLERSFLCVHPSRSIGLFFDPARRENGRRIFSVEDYHPPLSIVTKWLPGFPNMGVKISPAVKIQEIETYDAELEFISLRGELKEAVLWFGALKSGIRKACVLPGPHIMSDDGPRIDPGREISEPRSYFYEPDPAVIRAGLVQNLMTALNAAQIDPEIAYLSGDQRKETPFARVWEVEAWFPFQLKRLRAYLRERQVGLVTVKKRGSPIQPEELIHSLRLPKDGPEERVVFLSQMKGRPIVVVCYAPQLVN